MNNVRIELRERGKLMAVREGHNILTLSGREWLASMMAYASFGPDTPEATPRVRYMSVGIGGYLQTQLAAVSSAPLVTTYPAGEDPSATTGNLYDPRHPDRSDAIITTLERPVKISGSVNPYSTALGTDEWFIDTPKFVSTHQTLSSVTYYGRVLGADTLLAGFTDVPLSEVALHLNTADKNATYEPAIAYYAFDTLTKTSGNDLTFIWSWRF